MGWPKGKPRGPRLRQATTEREPIRKTWTMKAKPNWETAVDDPEMEDRLHIPREQIPEGMDFRWVASEVRGKPFPQWRARAEKTGWTPVHPEDFDGRFEGRFASSNGGEFNEDGLVLMARPLELSKRAKQRDRAKAREQVMIKEQSLRNGQDIAAMGADHPTAIGANRINRSFERLTIPKDE